MKQTQENKLVLIGGVPRTGKSTLTNKLVDNNCGLDTFRLDTFRFALSQNFGKCFIEDEYKLWTNTRQLLDAYYNRDTENYHYALPMINSILKRKRSLICEGLFLPQVVSKQDFFYTDDDNICELYLVRYLDDVEKSYSVLQEICLNDPKSWLAKYSDADIKSFAHVVEDYSKDIMDQAIANNKKFFNMTRKDIIDDAYDYILQFLHH